MAGVGQEGPEKSHHDSSFTSSRGVRPGEADAMRDMLWRVRQPGATKQLQSLLLPDMYLGGAAKQAPLG